jgi:radical SAM-linked protein
MRIRVNFERPEDICYIGYIDLKTVIERSLRRTLLPLKFTEGFNPRVKMEMGFPLSVGMAGEDEYFDFYLNEKRDMDLILNRLDESFREILPVKEIKEIPAEAPSLTSLDAILVNFIYGKLEYDLTEPEIERKISIIMNLSEIIVARNDKKKDLKPFIENLKLLKKDKLNLEMLFSVYFTMNGSIRVEEMAKVLKDLGIPVEFEYSIRKKTSVFYKGKLVSPLDF